MAEELPTAVTTAPAKVAKSPKKKSAPGSKKDGLSLSKMIPEELAKSMDRKGISVLALKKILAIKGVDVIKFNKRINATVTKLESSGVLVHVKGAGASGSLKLVKETKAAKPAAKKVVKKKPTTPVKAKKPAAKKTPAAKKVAVKRTAVKKSPKKVAAKKPAAKKSPKKAAVKKSPKKAAVKKSPKKPAAKKAPATKPATRKAKK